MCTRTQHFFLNLSIPILSIRSYDLRDGLIQYKYILTMNNCLTLFWYIKNYISYFLPEYMNLSEFSQFKSQNIKKMWFWCWVLWEIEYKRVFISEINW